MEEERPLKQLFGLVNALLSHTQLLFYCLARTLLPPASCLCTHVKCQPHLSHAFDVLEEFPALRVRKVHTLPIRRDGLQLGESVLGHGCCGVPQQRHSVCSCKSCERCRAVVTLSDLVQKLSRNLHPAVHCTWAS